MNDEKNTSAAPESALGRPAETGRPVSLDPPGASPRERMTGAVAPGAITPPAAIGRPDATAPPGSRAQPSAPPRERTTAPPETTIDRPPGVRLETVRDKTDTRERLIECAAELFWRQGYTSTGVAQILKSAEARSGSLYYFFPTKEDLLIAVLERYKRMLWPDVVQPVFDRVTDPIERIFGILDGYRVLLTMTDYTQGCPIGNLALELGDSHPSVRKLLADNFTGWREAVRGCLDEASNRLPADVDRGTLAGFILDVMEGAVMQARTYKSMEPYETAVAHLRDYVDRLIEDGTNWSSPKPDARDH